MYIRKNQNMEKNNISYEFVNIIEIKYTYSSSISVFIILL